jgi:hypothetical protein
MLIDTGHNARKEIRIGSYPEPESVPGANNPAFNPNTITVDPDTGVRTVPVGASLAATDGVLVDDTQYLRAQVVRKLGDYGRLDRGGQLIIPHIVTGIAIGTQIKDLKSAAGSHPVKGVVIGIEYRFLKPQQTILDIS